MNRYRIGIAGVMVCLFVGIFFVFDYVQTPHEESKANTFAEVEDLSVQETVMPIEGSFDLPVLGFHHVGVPPQHLSADGRTWYVSVSKLEEILDYLDGQDYTVMTTRDVLAALEDGEMPSRPIVLTFDDGSITFYDTVFPILRERGVRVEMYMPTRYNSRSWLNKEQIRELHQSGLVDFGTHGMYHEYLTRLSDSELRRILTTSKEDLEELLEIDIVSLAYPFGLYDDRVIDMVGEAGYQAAYTIRPGRDQSTERLYELHRYLVTESTNIATLLSK